MKHLFAVAFALFAPLLLLAVLVAVSPSASATATSPVAIQSGSGFGGGVIAGWDSEAGQITKIYVRNGQGGLDEGLVPDPGATWTQRIQYDHAAGLCVTFSLEAGMISSYTAIECEEEED